MRATASCLPSCATRHCASHYFTSYDPTISSILFDCSASVCVSCRGAFLGFKLISSRPYVDKKKLGFERNASSFNHPCEHNFIEKF